MKFREDIFYHKTKGSKPGVVHQSGKYSSLVVAIEWAKEQNAQEYELDWECLRLVKLFHYKNGMLTEVWSA